MYDFTFSQTKLHDSPFIIKTSQTHRLDIGRRLRKWKVDSFPSQLPALTDYYIFLIYYLNANFPLKIPFAILYKNSFH